MGSVQGQVLDTEDQPVASVRVQVLLLNRSADTDGQGLYQLADLPAGPMRLVASKAGYASHTLDLHLEAGLVHVVDFRLRSLPVPTPRHNVLIMEGEIGCALPAGTNCDEVTGTGQSFHHFAVDPGLSHVVIEVAWQPAAPGAGDRLQAELRAANATACGLPYAAAHGSTPVKLDVAQGFPLHGGHQCLRMSVAEDGTAALSQAYVAYVSVFYHSKPSDGYTAVPT